jgi:hypothetical protein
MNLLEIKNKKYKIKFSLDELLIIANSFNEVCNGIHIMNFKDRLGVPKEEARRILTYVGNVYDFINNQNNDSENTDTDRNFGILEVTDIDLEVTIKTIDEILKLIEPWEYQTRIGLYTEDAVKLNNSIKKLLYSISDISDK